MGSDENFLLKKECYDIVGVAMKVHSALGFGFLEAVYQEALALGFDLAKIPFSEATRTENSFVGTGIEENLLRRFSRF